MLGASCCKTILHLISVLLVVRQFWMLPGGKSVRYPLCRVKIIADQGLNFVSIVGRKSNAASLSKLLTSGKNWWLNVSTKADPSHWCWEVSVVHHLFWISSPEHCMLKKDVLSQRWPCYEQLEVQELQDFCPWNFQQFLVLLVLDPGIN